MTDSPNTTSGFRVGRGVSDITGEVADCGMLGYGKADQTTQGIHLRLRSRAFVVESGGERVLLVVAEIPLVFDSIHREVLRRLAASYDDTYGLRNVMLTATHTHCGPGGYAHHRLYNATTGGFRPQTFEAIVAGIVESVDRAHADLAPSTLRLAHGTLSDASSNRSRVAFDRNPAEDRAVFPDAVDPQTTLLTIERDGDLVGVVNWFATHGTSMTNRNQLISSDNKGYAAYHWERLVADVDHLDAAGPSLVAAFAQTNAGDMTPNLNHRPGSGPTEDEFENTRIIGERQYAAAADLIAGEPAGAGVDARTTYVKLSHLPVRPEFTDDGREHTTGAPIAGTSSIAGTDEGAGFPGFRQGPNPLLDALSWPFYRLSARLRDAHAPKGLTVPGGLINRIMPLMAERVPVQLLRIGRLHLIGIPGEVTIVAGLRLRRTVADILGVDLRDVLVAGYANGYIHYVTTPEEYDAQRYEGGSTLFGRWELAALRQAVAGLAVAMRDGTPVGEGDVPEPLTARGRERRLRNETAPGQQHGDVLAPPRDCRAGERVEAVFVTGHPNHDLHRGGTYLEVQRAVGDGWVRIADDSDWSTRLRWDGATSTATVSWDVPEDAVGEHRIEFHGSSGAGEPFVATTDVFTVT